MTIIIIVITIIIAIVVYSLSIAASCLKTKQAHVGSRGYPNNLYAFELRKRLPKFAMYSQVRVITRVLVCIIYAWTRWLDFLIILSLLNLLPHSMDF